MLETAHEGYEYQDYLSVAIILEQIINQKDTTYVIDRKVVENDKFDDLKVRSDSGISCFQIKYSDENHDHVFEKADLANGNHHDTAMSDLYFSWKRLKKKYGNVQCNLCVAWKKPMKGDGLYKVLQKAEPFMFPSISYKVNPDKLWPSGGKPLGTWVKLRKSMEAERREDFVDFCNEFRIILELPKASMNIGKPGDLENILFEQAKKLGVGIYPNHNMEASDVIGRLAVAVKKWRAKGTDEIINTELVLKQTRMITDYGVLNQNFPINEAIHIADMKQVCQIKEALDTDKKLVLLGTPGSGKSWMVQEFVEQLKQQKQHVIRFNCYTDLNDTDAEKRINKNVLISNLAGQLSEQFELEHFKNHRFGADKDELENLMRHVTEPCYVIVDGLDHIDRQYDLFCGTIGREETAIIDELGKIKFPDNFHVLLSSQPIRALDAMYQKGYKKFEIQKWNWEKIVLLLRIHGLEDCCDDNGRTLSGILEEKSQGNILYLSYLIREYMRENCSLQAMEYIPAYDNGLKRYYQYVVKKINSIATVYALVGADFYVSATELKEITGRGDEVDEDLKSLSPILNDNIVSGGVSIYHESFRRYIFETLSEAKMDVKKVVYRNLNDWMQELDFFTNRKAYCHRLELLFRSEEYQKALDVVNCEFVINSTIEGYSYSQIEANLSIAKKCACRLQDYCGVVLVSELMNVLDTTQHEVEDNEAYYQALCVVKGAEALHQRLEYDGKPTFSSNSGRDMCYICSKAGITSWWELYLDVDKEKISRDEYKYYFRFWVDHHGTDVIYRILRKLEKSRQGEIFAKEILEDVVSYVGEESLLDYVVANGLRMWETLLRRRKFYFYEVKVLSDEEFDCLYEKIRSMKHPTEESAEAYRSLFGQIYVRLCQGKRDILERVSQDYQGGSWYENWMIYTVRILELWAEFQKGNPVEDGQLEETVSFLTRSTDPFLGKPRACDLYALQGVMLETYRLPFAMVGSEAARRNLLECFSVVSEETTTTLSNAPGGPLTDFAFMELLEKIADKANFAVVFPYIEHIMLHCAQSTYYASTASVKFQIAKILAPINMGQAQTYYEEGVKFLLGYTMHKDMSLDSVVDSFPCLYEQNAEKAMQSVTEITNMTYTLQRHTDGRAVGHYPNIWFRRILKVAPKYAVSFLHDFQLKYHFGSYLEDMVLDVISEFSENENYTHYIIKLMESLPNCVSEKLFTSAEKVLERLMEKGQLRNAGMLMINLLSRFHLDQPLQEYQQENLAEPVQRILQLAKQCQLEVAVYESYFSRTVSQDNMPLPYEKRKLSQSDFSNRDTLCENLRKYPLTDEVIPQVVQLLEHADEKERQSYLDTMMEVDYFGENSYKQRTYLVAVLDQAQVGDDIRMHYYVKLFIASRSYGQSLIDTDIFLKAYDIQPEIAVQELFTQIAESKKWYMLSCGLVEVLHKISKLQGQIEKIWDVLMQVIRTRFPVMEEMDVVGNGQTDLQDSLRGIVLGRVFSEEKERFLAAYSYLVDIANEEDWTEAAVCIQWYFAQFDDLDYVGKMALLDYTAGVIVELPDSEQTRGQLLLYAPTHDFLLDWMFSYFQNLIQLEPLSTYLHATDGIVLGKGKHSYQRNPMMDRHSRLLERVGIDASELLNRIYGSEYVSEGMDRFVSPLHQFSVDNTFLKSVVLPYSVVELVRQAMERHMPEMAYGVIGFFAIDFREMDMYRRCRCLPEQGTIKDLACGSTQEEFTVDESAEEYVEIASFEIEKYGRHSHRSGVKMRTRGIVLPHAEHAVRHVIIGSSMEETEYCYDDSNEAFCELRESYDFDFQTESYLWIRQDLAQQYGIFRVYDDENHRMIGVDEDGTVVLMMYPWRCNYMGDNEYKGMEVPTYCGVKLYMRRDYVKKLTDDYGKIMFATVVE